MIALAKRHRRPGTCVTLVLFLLGLLWTGWTPAVAAPVPGIDVLYTTSADFDQGVMLNVNHDIPDQLQLNRVASPFPYVNIAASARGTVIRIHAETGAVLGEYLTAPHGRDRDPSRTTVDLAGNVWVANRAESSSSGGRVRGSVARIGVIIGGDRVDEDGRANPDGQYLAPPFGYNTCLDRNGDGLIRTSQGLGDILPWNNTGGVDNDGGVSTADDECIINYTRVTGTLTRTIAVDANNDVWVGGTGTRDHEKLDGTTGQPIPGTQFNVGCGGYGGFVDRDGFLWSARVGGTLRYVPSLGTGSCLSPTVGDYGLAIDPNTGEVWHTFLDGNRVARISPQGQLLGIYQHGNRYAQGVAVDAHGNVWVAHSFLGGSATTVGHLRTDGTFVGNVQLPPGSSGPTGIAVDSNGKIWVANYTSNNVVRIDPNAGPVGGGGFKVGAVDMTVSLGDGAWPYNYSDMTGFIAFSTTSPQGSWTMVQDSGREGEQWGTITWNTEPQGSLPPGSSITVEVRAFENQAGLSSQQFIPVTNGVPFEATGRFLEVRVTLKASRAGASPVLSDIRVKTANKPPTVSIGETVPVEEGGPPITIAADATDPDGDALTYAWSLTGPGTLLPMGATAQYSSLDGPSSAVVAVTVSDGKGGTATASRTLTTRNMPPVITSLTGPGEPVPLGTPVVITAAFTDPGVLDTHTATVDWGNGQVTPGMVTEANGSGTVTGSHLYTATGVYKVTVTVTDKDGDSDTRSRTEYIVVYDSSDGFVTGGGWVTSPAGAYTANPTLAGRANFGFVSKYLRGAMAPIGQTEFQFQTGNLNFHSTSYEWLVISGARAQYKGSGRINNAGDYGFILTATDGQRLGGGGVDKFRIKIWDKATGKVVYDNQLGAPDSADPATALGFGSIVIHGR